MATRVVRFGVIGCGLMGREFASAAARWHHLVGLDFRPQIVAACDPEPAALKWFEEAVPGVRVASDWRRVLDDREVEAVYVAIPHHLHREVYVAAIDAGKHLLGEKPFGIDAAANAEILARAAAKPDVLVRCSSEFPFFPGMQRIVRAIREKRFGRILDVRSGLLHSSDLDPDKPINWKRVVATNGESGCMGDLGMHALHVPLRAGWFPADLRAVLTKIVTTRPDRSGSRVPCETWDNAVLACRVGRAQSDEFPMIVETKRISPGDVNTLYLEIAGTDLSMRFTTRRPRTIESLPYRRGEPQAWHVADLGYASAYPAITGAIFEFGFPDAILQMWAAFCDELVHGAAGMRQPFTCATPDETRQCHAIFAAALESQKTGATVKTGIW
ncbi:MAG: Gfo/Idh/MocA family oxidoreductase [Planctomycetes bacterium]|nr:Gfo/Idh/MocA family oxidoreductase [Planctomycetota bacterium]